MLRIATVAILFTFTNSEEETNKDNSLSDSASTLVDLASEVFFDQADSTTDQTKKQQARSQTKRVGLEAFGMNMDAFDYGCHCNAIISGKQTGVGRPVDPLDSVCKDYLGCMRCVKKQTNCPRSDFYDYIIGDMAVECVDAEGSCSRNQCECDAKFYKDVWHLAVSGLSYDFQYNGAVFDPDVKCKKLDMGRMDAFWTSLKQDTYAQCCGGDNKPMEQFNTFKFSCCPGSDGRETLRRRC